MSALSRMSGCRDLHPASLPVPARRVLANAMAVHAQAGHENFGSLSDSHGFMPARPPDTALPGSHRAWDEIAERLPVLYRTQHLRRALDRLPVLRADDQSLPDRFLPRASALMSMLAHAYVRVEKLAPAGLPDSIRLPWQDVTRRLGRPHPFLSYQDLIVCNWRLRRPDIREPMCVENLDLLLPTVGNQEERVFYLTQVEILARTGPVVAAVVRAQEAACRDDAAALEAELRLIHSRLVHVTRQSLSKIDPRPGSPTHVDPVVWAKTVAPFAVPIHDGVQGPSGTSSPIFHLLDVFFERPLYESVLGQEALRIRAWYPPFWREFIEAVGEISVPGYVLARGGPELQRLLRELFEAYVGDAGFLGVHRRKVYGYLQMAFKVGRSVTIGGFQGVFEDRTWHEVDGALETTRRERACPAGGRTGRCMETVRCG